MPSRQEQVGLRQVTHRVRSTPSISSSPTVTSGEYGPILLNVPTSLTESIPSNITWTGGVAPYTLLVKLGSSSDVLQEFDGINATHFLWTPDVPAETLVSLQIVDARTVLTYTEDPILVGSGMDLAGFATFPASTLQSTFTSTFVTSVPSTTPSPSPSFPSDVQVAPQHNIISGSTIALTVIGIMIFLLLATFPWWRSCVRTRRRANRYVDTEKQEVVDGGNDGGQTDVESDTGSIDGRSMATRNSDPPVIAPSMNPFEDPENILYTEEIFAASPVSDFDDATPTQSAFISALPTSPRPANVIVLVRSLRTKLSSRSRPPSMSAQPDPSYTQPLSETAAARLSISTSSTLPPSYHTRSSVGSIQIPSPSYPAFPPPVYTPTVTETDVPPLTAPHPPSAFRPPVSRRAPQRRIQAPTPQKVLVLDTQNSGEESESESAYADGMWADSPRDRDPVAVESPGSLSGMEDAASEAAANPFADGRGVSSDGWDGDTVIVGMATPGRDVERTRTY